MSAGKLKYSAYVYWFKIIYFYFDGRQQGESMCHWQGVGSPPNVSTPFFPGSDDDDDDDDDPKMFFKSAKTRVFSK